MLHTGWPVQAKRDWANSPNEWAILRPSANGIIWKHLLEKKVRVGLRCHQSALTIYKQIPDCIKGFDGL